MRARISATTVSTLFAPPPLPARRPLGTFGDQVLALAPDHHDGRMASRDCIGPRRRRPEDTGNIRGRDSAFLLARTESRSHPKRSTARFIRSSTSRQSAIAGSSASMPARFRIGWSRSAAPATRARSRARPLCVSCRRPTPTHCCFTRRSSAPTGRFSASWASASRSKSCSAPRSPPPMAAVNSAIRVFTQNIDTPLIAMAGNGALLTPRPADARGPETLFERKADFGGRELKFVYSVQRDLAREGYHARSVDHRRRRRAHHRHHRAGRLHFGPGDRAARTKSRRGARPRTGSRS